MRQKLIEVIARKLPPRIWLATVDCVSVVMGADRQKTVQSAPGRTVTATISSVNT